MKKILACLLSISLVTTTATSTIACQNSGSKLEGETSFYTLSIGNGLFSFLKYNKNKAIVFDAGVGGNPSSWYENQFRKNVFPAEFMKSQGVEEIEAVFISHNHTDHYSNLWKIDEQFKINNLILPYNKNLLLAKIKSSSILLNKGKDINIIEDYSKVYNFDGIKFNNWSYYVQDYMKSTMGNSSEENNRSTVLQFTINNISFLVTGDSETAQVTQILKHVNPKPVDVFQVPHHGSANAGGPNLLKKISPKYCYISGTSGESEEPNWSMFDGGHPFPTASALNNLSNYCSEELNLTGTPYLDNSENLSNYNYTYEFKININKEIESIKHERTILETIT